MPVFTGFGKQQYARAPKTPALTIADLLFDGTTSVDDTESMLMTFGAKQLRTECYLRQLGIVKRDQLQRPLEGVCFPSLDLKRGAAEWHRLVWSRGLQSRTYHGIEDEDMASPAAVIQCDVLRPVYPSLARY
ncbi:hypothetical protein GQ600_2947 [Phytophthora cactorum]|nr:hypothetical protein GQ600_2947 [Phytophthora cactorum]